MGDLGLALALGVLDLAVVVVETLPGEAGIGDRLVLSGAVGVLGRGQRQVVARCQEDILCRGDLRTFAVNIATGCDGDAVAAQGRPVGDRLRRRAVAVGRLALLHWRQAVIQDEAGLLDARFVVFAVAILRREQIDVATGGQCDRSVGLDRRALQVDVVTRRGC